MWRWLEKLPLGVLVLACATLGLAPFASPHVWEKLMLLARWELGRPIDWLDLVFHGAPWILLVLKLARLIPRAGGGEV